MDNHFEKQLYKSLVYELTKPRELSLFRKSVQAAENPFDEWRKELDDYMQNHGFTLLGDGYMASVYGSNKYPYAIKLFINDRGYENWLKFCFANQDNPYVPKLRSKSITTVVKDPLIRAIRMEKLAPARTVGRRTEIAEFERRYDLWMYDNNYEEEDQHLAQVFGILKHYNNHLDLHDGNFMLRGDQLVVTDPFAAF